MANAGDSRAILVKVSSAGLGRSESSALALRRHGSGDQDGGDGGSGRGDGTGWRGVGERQGNVSVEPLSRDHTADDDRERERVTAAGGKVSKAVHKRKDGSIAKVWLGTGSSRRYYSRLCGIFTPVSR